MPPDEKENTVTNDGGPAPKCFQCGKTPAIIQVQMDSYAMPEWKVHVNEDGTAWYCETCARTLSLPPDVEFKIL